MGEQESSESKIKVVVCVCVCVRAYKKLSVILFRVGCVARLLMSESEILTRIWPHKLVRCVVSKVHQAPTGAIPTDRPTRHMALCALHCEIKAWRVCMYVCPYVCLSQCM